MATKYTAALSGIKEAKTKPETQPEVLGRAPFQFVEIEVTSASNEPAEQPKRKPGRPRGMRSDPNMEQTTIFLDKYYKDMAQTLLRKQGITLSELLNKHLTSWTINELARSKDPAEAHANRRRVPEFRRTK